MAKTALASIERPGVLVLRNPNTEVVFKVLQYCQDCGETHKDKLAFWVKDLVWVDAGNPDGVLCLYCLKRKLKRPMDMNHFEAEGFENRKMKLFKAVFGLPRDGFINHVNKFSDED